MLSPRRFELLHIPHQEIILPLNYRLRICMINILIFLCEASFGPSEEAQVLI